MRVISCHYFVYQRYFKIYLTWVVRGMMDVFHVYCFNALNTSSCEYLF